VPRRPRAVDEVIARASGPRWLDKLKYPGDPDDGQNVERGAPMVAEMKTGDSADVRQAARGQA
jgi:hypothetical protein